MRQSAWSGRSIATEPTSIERPGLASIELVEKDAHYRLLTQLVVVDQALAAEAEVDNAAIVVPDAS